MGVLGGGEGGDVVRGDCLLVRWMLDAGCSENRQSPQFSRDGRQNAKFESLY